MAVQQTCLYAVDVEDALAAGDEPEVDDVHQRPDGVAGQQRGQVFVLFRNTSDIGPKDRTQAAPCPENSRLTLASRIYDSMP